MTPEFTEENVDLKRQLASLRSAQQLPKGKSDSSLSDAAPDRRVALFETATSNPRQDAAREPAPQEQQEAGRRG